jgi:hypothetical protein
MREPAQKVPKNPRNQFLIRLHEHCGQQERQQHRRGAVQLASASPGAGLHPVTLQMPDGRRFGACSRRTQ